MTVGVNEPKLNKGGGEGDGPTEAAMFGGIDANNNNY